jgi:hypothetical protein
VEGSASRRKSCPVALVWVTLPTLEAPTWTMLNPIASGKNPWPNFLEKMGQGGALGSFWEQDVVPFSWSLWVCFVNGCVVFLVV